MNAPRIRRGRVERLARYRDLVLVRSDKPGKRWDLKGTPPRWACYASKRTLREAYEWLL